MKPLLQDLAQVSQMMHQGYNAAALCRSFVHTHRKEIAQMAIEARRYRWLRASTGNPAFPAVFVGTDIATLTAEQLDRNIDAVLAVTKEHI